MDESEKVQRRKEQRRQNRTRVRQVLLMTEYIQYKYFAIYTEAAEFYNRLNEKHPTKYDLRRTEEFRKWKMEVMGQPRKPRKCQKHSHANIETATQIHPQTPVIDEDQAPSPAPRSPSSQSEQSEQPETPVIDEDQAPSPAPRSPSSQSEQSEQPETPVIDEDQATTPDELRTGKHVYADNMQLRIPMLTSPTKHPAVITETLQTLTEETLQEGAALEPTLYQELTPEAVDKIINELRAEPDLQDIVTCIEQDLEFEQLGMDITMLEDDLVEKELENW